MVSWNNLSGTKSFILACLLEFPFHQNVSLSTCIHFPLRGKRMLLNRRKTFFICLLLPEQLLECFMSLQVNTDHALSFFFLHLEQWKSILYPGFQSPSDSNFQEYWTKSEIGPSLTCPKTLTSRLKTDSAYWQPLVDLPLLWDACKAIDPKSLAYSRLFPAGALNSWCLHCQSHQQKCQVQEGQRNVKLAASPPESDSALPATWCLQGRDCQRDWTGNGFWLHVGFTGMN